MNWPWQRRETRADSSYTDALIASITANAGGQSTAYPTATAALESCAGFVGRSFAAAEIEAPAMLRDVLDPALMSMIGRSLIRRGEIVFLIRVDRGQVKLLPAESHDIDGGPDPDSWVYRVSIGGPARSHTYSHQPAETILHLTYGRDPERPWRGYGPLQVAQLAGRLSAETSAALADESSGPRGSFLALPVDGKDQTLAGMKTDIRTARGSMLTVEAGDWDNPGDGRATQYAQQRFGAQIPDAMVTLQQRASQEVMGACGVSVALFDNSDGTSKREAYRQALHSTISPLGKLVQAELSRKLEADITITWAELRAADIAGRARAFQSLVGGGLDIAAAAAASGILTPEPT